MSAVKQNKALDFMKDYALYFVLLLLLVVIISKDASFLSLTNFSNVLTQSSVRIIIALRCIAAAGNACVGAYDPSAHAEIAAWYFS